MTRAASLAERREAAGPRPAPTFFMGLYDGAGTRSAASRPVSGIGGSARRAALMPAGMGGGVRAPPKGRAGLADPGRPGNGRSHGGGVWGFLKSAGAAALGLFGGLQVGDLLYSFALNGGGLPALGLTTAAAAGAAYLLRRSAAQNGPSWFLGPALGSFSFTSLGQLVWDVSGSPGIGLAAGAAAGLALALYGMGVGARKDK